MSILDFLTQKAVPQSQTETVLQMITGDASKTDYTPKQIMMYNRGYVFACNNKNAVTLASQNIKLYYDASYKKVKASKVHAISKKQANYIKSTTSNIKIKQATELVEVEEHPFINLINNINPRMNYVDFASLVQSYLGLIGNSFVYIEKENGLPVALYPLLSENITILKSYTATGYGEIKGYKYEIENKTETFMPEDIIHFINYQPGNAVYGRGELENCVSAAERAYYYDALENYLNKNNARPDFIAIYKNGIKEQEQKEVSKSWWRKFGNPKNAGKPMIASGDIDIKQLGFSVRDMQYPQGRKSSQDEIMAVFGVPQALVELNSANLASSQSATAHYMRYTIFPKLNNYCEKINEQLLPMWDDGLFCWYEPNEETDPTAQAQILNSYVGSGIMDINEAREKIGLEPKEEVEEVAEVEEVEEPKETIDEE